MESFLIVIRRKAPRGFSSSIQNPSSQAACARSLNTAFEDPRFCPQAANGRNVLKVAHAKILEISKEDYGSTERQRVEKDPGARQEKLDELRGERTARAAALQAILVESRRKRMVGRAVAERSPKSWRS